VPGWASAPAAWIRGIPHSARRAALTGCAAILLAVAVAAPLARQEVIDSVQFSVAFFATLLTGGGYLRLIVLPVERVAVAAGDRRPHRVPGMGLSPGGWRPC